MVSVYFLSSQFRATYVQKKRRFPETTEYLCYPLYVDKSFPSTFLLFYLLSKRYYVKKHKKLNTGKEFPEIDYFDVAIKNKTIVLRPVTVKPVNDRLDVIRTKMERLGITKVVAEDAVRWARKKKQ